MRQWYRIDAKKQDDAADVYIYDEIGQSFWNDTAVTAATFVAELNALSDSIKTIRVHINSPGGSVFEANAIANALRAQQNDKGRTVEVRIDGLAASAATIISSAGKPIKMADNALMMIHEPSGIVRGTAADMRGLATTLDTIRDTIIAAYRWVSKRTSDELSAMMQATTWMNAQQALDHGFVTEIVGASSVTACFRPEAILALGTVPDDLRGFLDPLIQQPTPPTRPMVAAEAAEVLRLCKAADCLDLAEAFVNDHASLATVEAALATERTLRTTARQRSADVAALCGSGHLDALAGSLAASNLPLEMIGALVTTVKALRTSAEIDTGLHPDHIAANTTASWKKVTDRVNRGRRSPFGQRQ